MFFIARNPNGIFLDRFLGLTTDSDSSDYTAPGRIVPRLSDVNILWTIELHR